jgi:hypothetical protein
MANIQISPSTSAQFEPTIAVNWLNPSVMVAVAVDLRNGAPNIGLYKSIDAGATWITTILPLPAGFTGIEAPHIDYLYPNTFVVAAHAFDSDGLSGSIVTYTSNDNASSFGAPVIVNQGYGQFVNDDQVIVTTDKAGSSPYFGNIYVGYTHDYNTDFNSGNTIFFNRSLNGGNTYETPSLISSINDYEEFPGMAITLDGLLIIGWITEPPGDTVFYTRTSDDGGNTFQPAAIVAPVDVPPDPLPGYSFRCLTYPNLGADISNVPTTRGNVYAVYQDYSQGYSDIFIAVSTDFGQNWGTPTSITGSPAGTQNFFPAITVSPSDGAVFVSYYTNRVNAPELDVYLATSRDGGNTFTNTRITTTSFSVDDDVLIGDYIGNAVVPQTDRLVSVWTDTQSGTQNIWFGDNQS